MPVIFVQTRHYYGSMQDYWTLVNLAGYPVIYDDEMDLENADHCYILTWFSAQVDRFAGAKARIICWNLEWADDPILPNVEYWSPDAWYAAQHGWKYVPVGGHRRFEQYPVGDCAELFDLALMMYRDPARRRAEIERISKAGLTVAPNGWGEERSQYLNQSRSLVHIHQLEGINTVSSLRFVLAAYYGLPVITETLFDAGIFKDKVIQAEYGYIAAAAKEWLSEPRRFALEEYGKSLRHLLMFEYTFRHVVDANV